MRPFQIIGSLGAACLAGCAAQGPGIAIPPTSFLSGAADPGQTGNGLPPDDGLSALSDLEGQSFAVRLARFTTDHTTGETVLVITDETVSAGAGYGSADASSFVLTIDAVPVVLTDGTGTAANGQDLAAYLNTNGARSGTYSVYTYAETISAGTFDTEGFHAFGFETDPAMIDALSGNGRYDGVYFGFSQILDDTGALLAREVENNGNLVLLADFSRGTIGGALAGTIETATPRPYDGTIATTVLVGNGFGSSVSLDCPAGASCSGEALIGGAFYGSAADEISGVIGFDHTVDDGDGPTRLVGAAGFTAVAE